MLVILLSLLALAGYSQDLAYAKFGDTGSGDLVIGWINVTDGQIIVDLELDIGNSSTVWGCDLTNSMSWHIHQMWGHNNDSWRGGSTQCGSTYTGGHYDPWLACGSATGASNCEQKGGCVPAGGSNTPYGGYNCSSATYDQSPYYCEVGDWSGKYGKLSLDSSDMLSGTFSSFYEVDASDLDGLSVVFHCSDGSRIFCAPFTVVSGPGSDERPDQSEVTTLYADFSDAIGTGLVTLTSDGGWSYEFTPSSSAKIKSSVCDGSSIYYYIFESWDSAEDSIFDTSGDDCMDATGGYTWDPTTNCLNMSINDGTYCDGNIVCGLDSGSDVYACDYSNDPYSCAPGDLSGKYGVLSLSAWNSQSSAIGGGTDRTLPDLYNIMSRSIGLVCGDTIFACARLQDTSIATATATFNDSSPYSSVTGSITISNNEITVDVDISDDGNITTACIGSGLKWHIHEDWAHNDSYARVGGTMCSGTYTGGHYDPYTACGSATGNDYCSTCSIPGSSYVTNNNGYNCTTETFSANPFVCEVGDLSGKYGALSPSSGVLSGTFDNQYAELRGTDLSGRSIVFHCDDGSRILCAPFTVSGTDGKDVVASGAASDSAIEGDNDEVMHVNFVSIFGANNYLQIWSNGKYLVQLNVGTHCTSNRATISLYKNWDGGKSPKSEGGCDGLYGNYFDPGLRCPAQANSTDCDCITAQSGFEYDCDVDNERYTCSVGDLGGKWGYLSTDEVTYLTGYDYTLPPWKDMDDLAVVVECLDGSYTAAACGGFRDGEFGSAFGLKLNYGVILFISIFGLFFL